MNMPALFVAAENDIRPSWPSEQLARLIPHAHFVMVENAAHYIWLDNANGLRRVLLDYLREVAK
jgi:proline iminopeptidase